MTTVLYTPNQTPILRDVVNRILNECGIASQPDLVTSKYLGTVTALNAVNDAVVDIKSRNLHWEFQKRTAVINLIPGINSYTVPADFARMAHPFSPWNGFQISTSLRELTPDEYYQAIPALNTSTPGTPQYYMVDSNVVTMFPPPSSDYISNWPQLQYVYMKDSGTPLGASDQTLAVDIPSRFIECVVAFGKWKMKLYLEYPDWQVEQQRYEQTLHTQMNRNNSGRRAPRLRTTFPSNSVW